MQLHAKDAILLGGDEDLVLHLSEPTFTNFQRLSRWFTLIYLKMRGI